MRTATKIQAMQLNFVFRNSNHSRHYPPNRTLHSQSINTGTSPERARDTLIFIYEVRELYRKPFKMITVCRNAIYLFIYFNRSNTSKSDLAKEKLLVI